MPAVNWSDLYNILKGQTPLQGLSSLFSGFGGSTPDISNGIPNLNTPASWWQNSFFKSGFPNTSQNPFNMFPRIPTPDTGNPQNQPAPGFQTTTPPPIPSGEQNLNIPDLGLGGGNPFNVDQALGVVSQGGQQLAGRDTAPSYFDVNKFAYEPDAGKFIEGVGNLGNLDFKDATVNLIKGLGFGFKPDPNFVPEGQGTSDLLPPSGGGFDVSSWENGLAPVQLSGPPDPNAWQYQDLASDYFSRGTVDTQAGGALIGGMAGLGQIGGALMNEDYNDIQKALGTGAGALNVANSLALASQAATSGTQAAGTAASTAAGQTGNTASSSIPYINQLLSAINIGLVAADENKSDESKAAESGIIAAGAIASLVFPAAAPFIMAVAALAQGIVGQEMSDVPHDVRESRELGKHSEQLQGLLDYISNTDDLGSLYDQLHKWQTGYVGGAGFPAVNVGFKEQSGRPEANYLGLYGGGQGALTPGQGGLTPEQFWSRLESNPQDLFVEAQMGVDPTKAGPLNKAIADSIKQRYLIIKNLGPVRDWLTETFPDRGPYQINDIIAAVNAGRSAGEDWRIDDPKFLAAADQYRNNRVSRSILSRIAPENVDQIISELAGFRGASSEEVAPDALKAFQDKYGWESSKYSDLLNQSIDQGGEGNAAASIIAKWLPPPNVQYGQPYGEQGMPSQFVRILDYILRPPGRGLSSGDGTDAGADAGVPGL